MKKILVALAALVWAGGASAGDYHRLASLRCSQCHTMHASRAHGLNNGVADPDFPNVVGNGGPFDKLLIANGVNALCLTCHDAKGTAPDVIGANTGMGPAGTRSAGALNGSDLSGGHIVTGEGYQDWMGHTMNAGEQPPGFTGGAWFPSTGAEGFNCSNCHAVHGSPAYRNLGLSMYAGLPALYANVGNPMYTAGPTYNAVNLTTGVRAVTAFDPTKDITIGVAARDYQTANVTFGIGSGNAASTPPSWGANTWKANGMNELCAACHGQFHGTVNTVNAGATAFIRHPTSGIVRLTGASSLLTATGTADGMTTAQTGLVRPAWTAAVGGNFEAACLTCHKGHGNQRGYGLIYPNNVGTPVNYEQGDAAALPDGAYPIRNLCITCHPMGRF
jgi:hypothetical protein